MRGCGLTSVRHGLGRTAALVVLVSAAFGCVSSTPASLPAAPPTTAASRDVAPHAGKAAVYFYSMPGWVSPDSPLWILEGRNLVASIEAGSYSLAYLSPGEHWLRSWKPAAPPHEYRLDCFDFEPSRSQYVLLGRDGAMSLSTSEEFHRLVEADPGLKQHEVSPALAEIARRTVPLSSAKTGAEKDEQGELASPAPGTVLLSSGTSISLRLIENANSFNTKPGEPVLFEVERDVPVGEDVVVPEGLIVQGIVLTVQRPGAAGMPGLVEIEVSRLVLPSGDVVPLQGFFGSAGRPSGAAGTLGALGGAGVQESVNNADVYGLGFALLMFIAMAAVRGHDAWMGAGTMGSASVHRDTFVRPVSFPDESEPEPPPPGEAVAATSMGAIVVPDNARVTGPWCVRLEMPNPPSRVWITSVGDLSPPRDVSSSKIVPHGTWQEIQFPAWPVARFAVLGPWGPATLPVRLEGTLADGSTFYTTVDAVVRTEKQR